MSQRTNTRVALVALASAPPLQVTELKRRGFAKSSNTFFSFFSHVPPTRRRELQAQRDEARQSTLDACFRVTNARLLWLDSSKRAVPLLDLGSFKWVYLWTSGRPAARAALLCRSVFRCRRWCGSVCMTPGFYFHPQTQNTPPPPLALLPPEIQSVLRCTCAQSKSKKHQRGKSKNMFWQ